MISEPIAVIRVATMVTRAGNIRHGVIYHSREWETLVETGWITHAVVEYQIVESGYRAN